MRKVRIYSVTVLAFTLFFVFQNVSLAWHDETHIAVAKRAGYTKWFNACGADMAKLKPDMPSMREPNQICCRFLIDI
jgi:hypothetical protein